MGRCVQRLHHHGAPPRPPESGESAPEPRAAHNPRDGGQASELDHFVYEHPDMLVLVRAPLRPAHSDPHPPKAGGPRPRRAPRITREAAGRLRRGTTATWTATHATRSARPRRARTASRSGRRRSGPSQLRLSQSSRSWFRKLYVQTPVLYRALFCSPVLYAIIQCTRPIVTAVRKRSLS